ncbi:conserved hypothetical protein [Sphingomonas sp. EC-HK361]|uniref:hypothetical protein n=1 Tax=Sphingomonas sp. EC-HK361 TaxID=2038397 RepID=UPI00125C0EF3|nr:hypothetical protein [Sphingomonas sp. EC-HK361]VVT25352.1 conserved hypothetical protein [Sphingomonas sp. EC-HK361]
MQRIWFRRWFGFALRPVSVEGWALVAILLLIEAALGWVSLKMADGVAWWLMAILFTATYVTFYFAALAKTAR